MVLLESIVGFFYFFAGSASIGYFFLRVGWQKGRTLETSLKAGWSIVFGAAFSLIVGTASFLEAFFGTSVFGLADLFAINALAGISTAIIALTLKRKFFAQKKLRVIVPKEIVSASIAAERAIHSSVCAVANA